MLSSICMSVHLSVTESCCQSSIARGRNLLSQPIRVIHVFSLWRRATTINLNSVYRTAILLPVMFSVQCRKASWHQLIEPICCPPISDHRSLSQCFSMIIQIRRIIIAIVIITIIICEHRRPVCLRTRCSWNFGRHQHYSLSTPEWPW